MINKFIFLLCLLSSINLQAAQHIPAMPDELLTYKTVNDKNLKLHMFYPEGYKKSDSRPAIIFFFGGSWNVGKPKQFYEQSKYLASRGMVAISAEYRVRSRDKSTPYDSVRDGNSAIRWVRKHAKSLGINPNEIIAGGGSAGGHIAAAAATTVKYDEANEDLSISSQPNALVLFNPVFDNGPGGFGYDRVKPQWQDFSPMHNIHKDTPPTIMFFGTNDKFVPIETAKKYKAIMDKNQLRAELFIYQGKPHGFFNFHHKQSFSETVIETDKFLVSLGYLNGKNTMSKYLGQSD